MIQLIKYNWTIYFFTIVIISVFATGFIFLLGSIVLEIQDNALDFEKLYNHVIGVRFHVVWGSIVTVPVGIISICIFHQLWRRKRQSSFVFGLIGLCFGLLYISSPLYYSEMFNLYGILLIIIFLGGGYLTGSIIYSIWHNYYTLSPPSTK